MNQITLHFPTILKLAGFIQAVDPTNYEINYKTFSLSCEAGEEMIQVATTAFQARVLQSAPLEE